MGDKYPQIFDDDKEHWRAICNSRSIYEVLYFYFNLYIITEQFLWRYLLQKFFPLNIRVQLLKNPYVLLRVVPDFVDEDLPFFGGRCQEIKDKIRAAMKNNVNSGSKKRRLAAARILISTFHDDAAYETIIELIKDSDPSIRIKALQALESHSNTGVKEESIAALSDPVFDVRSMAAYQLAINIANREDSDVIEALRRYSHDSDFNFRIYVAFALYCLGGIVSSDELVSIMLNKKHHCRYRLFSKLSLDSSRELGFQLETNHKIVEAYVKIARDESDKYQNNALVFLYEHFGPKYTEVFQTATKSSQKYVRLLTAKILKRVEGLSD